jgi:hypothetical protein
MARSKTTTTTTTTATITTATKAAAKAAAKAAVQPQRVTSLEPAAGRQLSSLEEAVVRMHHGVSVKAAATLATNAVTDVLAGQLLDMEVDAHIATGRSEELPDVPADDRSAARKPVGNARTQKLLSALKKK